MTFATTARRGGARRLAARLARSNVRKNLRSYSVYFATLAFCACLLYTYASCADTISAIGSGDAVTQGLYTMQKAAQFIVPLGVFSIVVFCFLAGYAARFIARRRKRELGLLELFGMTPGQVAGVLRMECRMVGLAAAGAGIAAGVALSPLSSLLAAWSFHLSWKPTIVVSPAGCALALGGFLLVGMVSSLASRKEIRRSSIADLLDADRTPEASRRSAQEGRAKELVLGIVCLALGYGICLSLVGFILLMVPIIALVVVGSWLVLHAMAGLLADAFRRLPAYWSGTRPFMIRQLEAHLRASSSVLAISAALLAVGTCAIAMATGIRNQVTADMFADPEAMAAIGSFVYIILFFGLTFLAASFAVLALHQMAEGQDEHPALAKLHELGATDSQLRGALRAETSAFFLTPLAVALVHCAVGFYVAEALLVNLFELPHGTVSYPAVFAMVGAAFLAYLALCVRIITRGALEGQGATAHRQD